MPRVELPNFGAQGVNTDRPPWGLPLDYLTSAENVDLTDGAIRSDAGTIQISAYPNSGGDTPRQLFFERDGEDLHFVVCGDASVWTYESRADTWGDISSTAGYTGPSATSVWSQAQLSDGVSVYNCSDWHPEHWSPPGTATALADLPYDPGTDTWRSRNYKARWMTAHRGHLIALGVNKAGTDHSTMFKCSHVVSPGNLPSWDETDITLRAREIYLDDDAGPLLCGYPLRGGIACYKRYSTWMMESTNAYSGSLPQVYAGRRVLDRIGALGPHCVVSYQTHHFLAVPGDIGVFDGNRFQSLASDQIRKLLNQVVDPDNAESSYAVLDRFEQRVWFCFAEFGASQPTLAVIYNVDRPSWTTRRLGSDVVSCATGLFYRAKPTIGSLNFPISSWTDPIGGSSWGSMVANVAQMTSTHLHTSRRAGLDTDSSALTWHIERTNMQLAGVENKVTVTDVFIQATWEDVDLTVRIGAQEYPGAPIAWEAPQTFNPSTDRKVSVRSTGNLHALKISGPSSFLTLIAGITFLYEVAGRS